MDLGFGNKEAFITLIWPFTLRPMVRIDFHLLCFSFSLENTDQANRHMRTPPLHVSVVVGSSVHFSCPIAAWLTRLVLPFVLCCFLGFFVGCPFWPRGSVFPRTALRLVSRRSSAEAFGSFVSSVVLFYPVCVCVCAFCGFTLPVGLSRGVRRAGPGSLTRGLGRRVCAQGSDPFC